MIVLRNVPENSVGRFGTLADTFTGLDRFRWVVLRLPREGS